MTELGFLKDIQINRSWEKSIRSNKDMEDYLKTIPTREMFEKYEIFKGKTLISVCESYPTFYELMNVGKEKKQGIGVETEKRLKRIIWRTCKNLLTEPEVIYKNDFFVIKKDVFALEVVGKVIPVKFYVENNYPITGAVKLVNCQNDEEQWLGEGTTISTFGHYEVVAGRKLKFEINFFDENNDGEFVLVEDEFNANISKEEVRATKEIIVKRIFDEAKFEEVSERLHDYSVTFFNQSGINFERLFYSYSVVNDNIVIDHKCVTLYNLQNGMGELKLFTTNSKATGIKLETVKFVIGEPEISIQEFDSIEEYDEYEEDTSIEEYDGFEEDTSIEEE